VDQKRQAGSQDDTALLPSLSRQRAAAVAKHHRLQPGQSVAAGVAQEDRHLVTDQLAAAAGQDRQAIAQPRRYYWQLLSESHLMRRLLGTMLAKIVALPSG
jgi:hypothetical protein